MLAFSFNWLCDKNNTIFCEVFGIKLCSISSVYAEMNRKKGILDETQTIGLIGNNLKRCQASLAFYKELLAPSEYSQSVRQIVFPPTQPSLQFHHQAVERPSPPVRSSSRSHMENRNPRTLDRLFLYDDAKFRSIMKVSRQKLDRIFCELQQIGTSPPIKVIGLFSLLYYLTDANCSFHQLADMIEVDLNVVESLIENTARAVVFNLQEFARIKWPDDMVDVMNGFQNVLKSRFARIGGILGHEILDVGRGPSIMVQLVVDYKGLIRHFKVDCTTDPVELLESSIIYDLLNGSNEPWFVLCDASYPRLVNLLPPYSGDMRFKEKEYNQTHLKTRQVLFDAFNNLFSCFPKLKNLEKPSLAIVGAALVFYNVIYGS